ncbi:GntR family transcriptional regulator [Nocardioides sp.]|uniref:GntR family transcriptional regulator n=1 Tax=Nocardioides sp. TaxID=35761 RepID=UPI002B952AF5|nr:GntR family transcriptional regulator [Nocardioides sp.]HSX69052.1 GntR family transcriptional regulator [Nocardioides sp.]
MTDAISARGPLQTRIVHDIRNQIEAGELRDGEALPSTRTLAERFGVSVFTINEAMKVLAAEGLVENQSRSRRTVRAPGLAAATRPEQPRRIVLVGGYAGSGKTELGRVLARQTGWPVLDKDTMTRPLVERALEALGQPANDRDSEVYSREIRPHEYEALMAAAYENADCGVAAIVTAPFVAEFSDAAWLERERARFEERGVPAEVVWVACDAETMHTYIRRRGAARDAAKLADWPAYLAKVDPNRRPAGAHHVIDNSVDAEPLTAQAKRLLEAMSGATA